MKMGPKGPVFRAHWTIVQFELELTEELLVEELLTEEVELVEEDLLEVEEDDEDFSVGNREAFFLSC